MTEWTYAQVLDNGKSINPIVFGYVVKRNGVPVGTIKHTGRPRSAGGSAWRGQISEGLICSGVNFYDKNIKKVLEWFKSDYDDVMRAHGKRA